MIMISNAVSSQTVPKHYYQTKTSDDSVFITVILVKKLAIFCDHLRSKLGVTIDNRRSRHITFKINFSTDVHIDDGSSFLI